MITIMEIEYKQVKTLVNKAKYDKVCLKDTKTTKWFGAFIDKLLCGVAGTILKNGKGRIRGVFVVKEHRKLGMGSQLMKHIINYLSDNHACYIDQLASNPEWWVKNNWKIKSLARNGAWIYKTI
jgi:GNAT superfamily N-acetyltransferase